MADLKEPNGLGIYSKHKAVSINGKWNKEHGKCLQEKMLITHKYAQSKESGYSNSGIYYKFHEAKTKEYCKGEKIEYKTPPKPEKAKKED